MIWVFYRFLLGFYNTLNMKDGQPYCSVNSSFSVFRNIYNKVDFSFIVVSIVMSTSPWIEEFQH